MREKPESTHPEFSDDEWQNLLSRAAKKKKRASLRDLVESRKKTSKVKKTEKIEEDENKK